MAKADVKTAAQTQTDDDDEIPSVMEFSEDVSNAEAPPPLPLGEYEATIRRTEVKVAQSSGNRYVAVSFHIPPEDYPADFDIENAPDGTTVIYRRVPFEDSAQARFRMRQFCEAIEAPMSRSIDVNDWIGLTAKVSITHEKYEGIPRAVITRVSAII